MIRVEKLSKSFNGRQVLRDISLAVEEGELLAIMGSSGGGKTTLLKCISGLIPYDNGKVEIEGISVADEPDKARTMMGMVFQSAALFDYLNVRDNILFGVRRLQRPSKADEERLLQELLEKVDLVGYEELMPAELSGGMRKRVGLARAIATKPKVLLYDEPTTGLDPITTYTVDELMVKTSRSEGIASIVVSHDLVSVRRIASKVAFLEQGEITYYGDTEGFVNSDREAIRDLVQKSERHTFL